MNNIGYANELTYELTMHLSSAHWEQLVLKV